MPHAAMSWVLMRDKTRVSRENPCLRSDQLKQNPFTVIVELGGVVDNQSESQRNTAQNFSHMVSHPGSNLVQQGLTPVNRLEPVSALGITHTPFEVFLVEGGWGEGVQLHPV